MKIKQHPDAYQHERAERFGCSQCALCKTLKRLEIYRKNFFHPKADEEARRLFKRKISVYELMRLSMFYIDESGFSEDMPRIRQQVRDVSENMIRCQSGELMLLAH